MPAIYVKEEGTNIVHVVNQISPGCEFTMCDLDYSAEGSDDDGSFYGEAHNGPANCEFCRQSVDYVREMLKNLRWRR